RVVGDHKEILSGHKEAAPADAQEIAGIQVIGQAGVVEPQKGSVFYVEARILGIVGQSVDQRVLQHVGSGKPLRSGIGHSGEIKYVVARNSAQKEIQFPVFIRECIGDPIGEIGLRRSDVGPVFVGQAFLSVYHVIQDVLAFLVQPKRTPAVKSSHFASLLHNVR